MSGMGWVSARQDHGFTIQPDLKSAANGAVSTFVSFSKYGHASSNNVSFLTDSGPPAHIEQVGHRPSLPRNIRQRLAPCIDVNTKDPWDTSAVRTTMALSFIFCPMGTKYRMTSEWVAGQGWVLPISCWTRRLCPDDNHKVAEFVK